MAENRPVVSEKVVVARFLGAWAVLSLAGFQARGFNDWLDRSLAWLLAHTLMALRSDVHLAGDVVFFSGRILRIADPCNGLQLVEILLALVWAWPVTWSDRGRALLWMMPALFLVNMVRLCSLVPLLIHRPQDFETIHQYVWQVAMVGITLAIGVAWMSRSGTHALARRRD